MRDRISELVSYFHKALGRMPKKVGLVGLGKSNLALLDVLMHIEGITVTLRDSRCDAPLPPLCKADACFLGGEHLRDIDEDVLFLSPSVRRDALPLIRAERCGTLLSSDCEVFFSDVRAPLTLAVTGSDGKSTVTELSARLLTESGVSASAIGNIGVPYVERDGASAYVTELSSFNLTYLEPTAARAVITNITENHLNWHKSFDEYKSSKRRILNRAGGAVLSLDDPECKKIAREISAFALFSTDMSLPRMRECSTAEHYYHTADGYIMMDGERIVEIDSLCRKEKYNIKNMMAALALTHGYTQKEAERRVLTSFRGLPHRCELIYCKGGVSVYNSSIDTSPARCAATLKALGRGVRILLGGRGKGLSFDQLSESLAGYAEKIAVYGDEASEISAFIESDARLRDIPCGVFESFREAVDYLLHDIGCGECALLSPACTAYGEFKDFEERGRCFTELVHRHFL